MVRCMRLDRLRMREFKREHRYFAQAGARSTGFEGPVLLIESGSIYCVLMVIISLPVESDLYLFANSKNINPDSGRCLSDQGQCRINVQGGHILHIRVPGTASRKWCRLRILKERCSLSHGTLSRQATPLSLSL